MYLKIFQTQKGLDKQQASCTAIRRGGNVKQFVDVKQGQKQINDTTVFTTVGQSTNLVQRLALLKRCQLLPHARCKVQVINTRLQQVVWRHNSRAYDQEDTSLTPQIGCCYVMTLGKLFTGKYTLTW